MSKYETSITYCYYIYQRNPQVRLLLTAPFYFEVTCVSQNIYLQNLIFQRIVAFNSVPYERPCDSSSCHFENTLASYKIRSWNTYLSGMNLLRVIFYLILLFIIYVSLFSFFALHFLPYLEITRRYWKKET